VAENKQQMPPAQAPWSYAIERLQTCGRVLSAASDKVGALEDLAAGFACDIRNGWLQQQDVSDKLDQVAEAFGLYTMHGRDVVQATIDRAVASIDEQLDDSLWKREDQKASQQQERQWPVLDAAALQGLAGDVVNTIAPHSEADSVALLVQFLAVAGNMFGRRCYYSVESDRHHANLFAVLVGPSSKARKGTSFGRVCAIAKTVDPAWVDDRCKGGLSSGEGLIDAVRDQVVKWDPKQKDFDVVDPGIADKRLMIIEPEFAGALAVMERHGNTLSPLLRKSWDGNKLATMTRNNPLTATGAHISIVAHVTESELRARLTRTDAANGFANRFIFPLVRRSKELPFGGDLTDSEIFNLGELLAGIVSGLPAELRIIMTADARAMWADVYHDLSNDRPGLLGSIVARAEAQVVRISMIYALLAGQQQIGTEHLSAAISLWNYCEASAAYVFGDSTGDVVVDDIVRALRSAGEAGLSRTSIRDLFGRHQSSDRIGAALADLLARKVARCETRQTGGRPAETWFAMGSNGRG
jgi:Protein of unknown function (DUF3987)